MGAEWRASTDGRIRLRIYPGGVAGDEGGADVLSGGARAVQILFIGRGVVVIVDQNLLSHISRGAAHRAAALVAQQAALGVGIRVLALGQGLERGAGGPAVPVRYRPWRRKLVAAGVITIVAALAALATETPEPTPETISAEESETTEGERPLPVEPVTAATRTAPFVFSSARSSGPRRR